MLENLTAQRKFQVAAILLALTTAVIATAGLWGATALTDAMNHNATIADALRNHLEGDMMHDALRADVLDALVSAEVVKPEEQERVVADLRDHVANFESLIQANQEMALPDDVQAALAQVDAPLRSYIDSATSIVTLASRDRAAAVDRMPEFTERFAQLEVALSSVSDRIQAVSAATQADGNRTAEQSKIMTALGLALGLVVALAVYFFASRTLVGPIVKASGVLEKLAAGDDNVEVAATARKDEIGRLWRAMAALKATVSEAFRLKTMVDEMPINVMMADPNDDFRLTYLNKTSQTTLRAIEPSLPVKADQVGAGTVETFKVERRIVADPANLPWNAKIKMGVETLDLRVSAIRDRTGKYIGPMVSWQVVTKQVKMIDDFEANVKVVVDTVASASTELQANAQSMSATAEETNRQAGAVAAASEQATANVQTVASASEELASSIAEIGRQVSQSASIASMAVDEAKKTDATVQGLSEAAQKIGEVVRLISDIASQTNLLALNATIEAARAGEAGKGFAVVASEVKSLATQTAKATEEIAAQIGAIQGSTKDAVVAIQSIGRTIAEINDISATISAAVEEQGAATREIARNVQEASQGTTEVSSNIAGVTQAAGETGSAASQVLSAAAELSAQSEKLKAEVESFLVTVRAA